MAFNDNLKSLPGVSHLASIELLNEDGLAVALIENKPGQAGSLTVYNHLAQTYGLINKAAASKGLELYAEHTEDARAHPGKHPNIDRLLQVVEAQASLRVRHNFAA